ncbi:MAG: class I SAM-dependent methyltransferase [Kineosporiaceae bacterium]|nr:class I SAM-dependent methyltransferase [Aeromicrobium sp.]
MKTTSTSADPADLFVPVPEGSRVLRVGSAGGEFEAVFRGLKGCTVVAIDGSRVAIPGALDGLDLFDVAVITGDLEHLEVPSAAVRLMEKALAPGGFIVISAHDLVSASAGLNLVRGGDLSGTHIDFYDRSEGQVIQFVAVGDLPALAGIAVRASPEVAPIELDPVAPEPSAENRRLADENEALWGHHARLTAELKSLEDVVIPRNAFLDTENAALHAALSHQTAQSGVEADFLHAQVSVLKEEGLKAENEIFRLSGVNESLRADLQRRFRTRLLTFARRMRRS